MADDIAVEVIFRVEFYDVDSMNVVWHGNYAKYMELGRCALLDDIGFGYVEMAESGYVWPVVDMRIKFIKPLRFGQRVVLRARLAEYENRLKIKYEIRDVDSDEKTTIAESVQMAVNIGSNEGCLVSPACLVEQVEKRIRENR
jgi:acyl-CoA thioester hydrolase